MRDTIGDYEFDAKAAFAGARRRVGMPRPVGASWGGWGAVACPRSRKADSAVDTLTGSTDDTSATRSAKVLAPG